jgi:hypothetical protein
MKRSATVLVVALLGSGLATSGALAATSKTKWDVVAGTFKTKSAAAKDVSKLKAKHLTGFKAVKSGKQYKVERAFSSQAKAKAELSKLKKDGFKGAKVVKA